MRENDPSIFATILDELLAHVPGAYAASLVDEEGECVDYAGRVDTFHVKVAAAHLRIVFEQMRQIRAVGHATSLVLRGARESLSVHSAGTDYALTLLYSRGAGFVACPRALAVALRRFAEEGGWSYRGERWYAADLELDERGRPRLWKSCSSGQELEVVGGLVGLGRGERGYRVYSSGGVELMLVRERSGSWFSDEPPEPRSTSMPVAR